MCAIDGQGVHSPLRAARLAHRAQTHPALRPVGQSGWPQAGSGQGGAEHAHTKPVGHRVCTGVHAARGSGTDSPVPSLPTWAVGGGAGTGRGQTIASAGARAAASPGQRHAGATGMAAEKPTSHACTAVSNIGKGTGWPDRWGRTKRPQDDVRAHRRALRARHVWRPDQGGAAASVCRLFPQMGDGAAQQYRPKWFERQG